MKPRFKFSLRKKIILIFLVFLMIPLLITGILIHRSYFRYFLEKEVSLSGQKLEELSGKMNEYLAQIEQLAFDVCYQEEVQALFRDFKPDRFIGSRVEDQFFGKLFGINRLDNLNIFYLKTAAPDNRPGFSVGTVFREEYGFDKIFTGQTQNKTLWCSPRSIQTFDNSTPSIVSFYQSISDPGRLEPIGTLRIDIQESVFRDMLLQYSYLSESGLFLIDGEGRIISGTDSNNTGACIPTLLNSEAENIFSDRNPEEPVQIMNAYYYVLPPGNLKNGWKLLSILPASAVESQAMGIKQYAALTGLTGISFTVLLCVMFSFIVTKPLNELIALTQKIKNGELDAKSTIKTQDEFGVLASSFNSMTDNITQLIETNVEIKRQESISELLYLQSQINPHFLYNTLDSIRFTARRNKDFEAAAQIERLSDLFRYYLNKKGEYVRFSDELEHLRTYMQIQQARFQGELTYEVHCEEAVLELYTIKLILQPLAENCIVHGFENKLGGGTIKIECFIKENAVILKVEDNGTGTDPEPILKRLAQEADSQKFSALKNINDRIKLHFGNRYGLVFTSIPGKGTCVTVTLPVIIPPHTEDLYAILHSETLNGPD